MALNVEEIQGTIEEAVKRNDCVMLGAILNRFTPTDVLSLLNSRNDGPIAFAWRLNQAAAHRCLTLALFRAASATRIRP